MKLGIPLLSGLLLCAATAAVQAQFSFATNGGAITITGYSGPGGAVTIPADTNGLLVTSIGDAAFFQVSNLTSLTLPGSITNIGQEAFEYCSGLAGIAIPGNVAAIGVEAFADCSGLTNATIVNGVASIGDFAFDACSGLANVALPSSVTNLGVSPFADCSSLTAITVDPQNSIYSSSNGVLFNKGQTTLLELPGGLGGSYTIPAGVTGIGDWAFGFCANLTGVTIPVGVTSLGDRAFFGSGLANLIIPGSVTNIGQEAFEGCFNLAAVTIPTGPASIGNSAFYLCTRLASVTLPGSVTNIGDFAFGGCASLSQVALGSGIGSLGQGAFENCYGLASLTLPGSVTNIGDSAFSGCASLANIDFLGNAPAVASNAFTADVTATVYYLPGAAGWSTPFAGRPAAFWVLPSPLILNNGPGFGVQSNGFGFTISWATNIPVVVEACANLAHPAWIPLQTNALTNGACYFIDSKWTNYPARFYRLSAS
jgi:hypothetical protein